MRTRAALFVILTTIIGAGCSIRPIPQDVTRHTTYNIAQRIRCEFRDALGDLVVATLRRSKENGLADALVNGTIKYDTFLKTHLARVELTARTLIQRYSGGAIAYEFEFDIIEENKLSGAIGLTDVFTRGALKLPFSAASELKRQDKRNFRVVDVFSDLLSNPLMEKICAGEDIQLDEKNIVYPIDGAINLREVLTTFISLVQSGNVVGDSKGNTQSVPTFADVITYTTKFSSGLKPKLTLSAVGASLQVEGVDLDASNSREDAHKVTVALTLPSAAVPLTVAQKRGAAESAERATSASRAAINELERQRIKSIDADTGEIRRRLLLR
jgi:hypothetical protein